MLSWPPHHHGGLKTTLCSTLLFLLFCTQSFCSGSPRSTHWCKSLCFCDFGEGFLLCEVEISSDQAIFVGGMCSTAPRFHVTFDFACRGIPSRLRIFFPLLLMTVGAVRWKRSRPLCGLPLIFFFFFFAATASTSLETMDDATKVETLPSSRAQHGLEIGSHEGEYSCFFGHFLILLQRCSCVLNNLLDQLGNDLSWRSSSCCSSFSADLIFLLQASASYQEGADDSHENEVITLLKEPLHQNVW
jgi:hypothetical protein